MTPLCLIATIPFTAINGLLFYWLFWLLEFGMIPSAFFLGCVLVIFDGLVLDRVYNIGRSD